MKNVTSVILLFIVVSMVSFLSSCGYEITRKVDKDSRAGGSRTTCDEEMYNTNYEKYKNATFFNSNIQINSSNVIDKANEIRNKILTITSVEIESFSASNDRAEIRVYIPEKKVASVQKMLSTYPDIINISERQSNIGSSYVDYAKKYTFYKILNDNFEVVEELVMDETCGKADVLDIKKMIQNNLDNYENNIKNYKKQINNAYYQISITKK